VSAGVRIMYKKEGVIVESDERFKRLANEYKEYVIKEDNGKKGSSAISTEGGEPIIWRSWDMPKAVIFNQVTRPSSYPAMVVFFSKYRDQVYNHISICSTSMTMEEAEAASENAEKSLEHSRMIKDRLSIYKAIHCPDPIFEHIMSGDAQLTVSHTLSEVKDNIIASLEEELPVYVVKKDGDKETKYEATISIELKEVE
jgi:hypothetical protein